MVERARQCWHAGQSTPPPCLLFPRSSAPCSSQGLGSCAGQERPPYIDDGKFEVVSTHGSVHMVRFVVTFSLADVVAGPRTDIVVS